jgi:hypothetical protein
MMTNREVWKPVVGYEDYYMVSSRGNVISIRDNKQRPRKLTISRQGYYVVSLTVKYKANVARVHRLVAEAFLENPHNKQTVNHKDSNKLNNSVENLEWATYRENCRHAMDAGAYDNAYRLAGDRIIAERSKQVLCVDTGEIWFSLSQCSRQTGLRLGNLFSVCSGLRKRTGGKRFKYITREEYDSILASSQYTIDCEQ